MGIGGGGGPTNTTSTTTTELPDWIQPHAEGFLGQASNLAQTPFSQYEGARTAPLNALHQQGLAAGAYQPEFGNARNLANDTLQGQFLNTPMGQAQGLGNATLRGDFLNSNPYLDRTFNRAADAVTNRFASATQGSGLHNAGAQQMMGRNLNDLATNIYGGNYAQERQNQQNMAGLAAGAYGAERGLQQSMIPMGTQLPGQQAQLNLGLGDVTRGNQQEQINANMQRFQEAKQHPFEMLNLLGRGINNALGGGAGTTTQTGPGFFPANPTANLIGGGSAIFGALAPLFRGGG